jgi:xanthine dehydrogenase YagS FAD-binding subunit
MRPFEFQRASDPQAAVSAIGSASSAKFLAGGTNLIDLMKQHVETPAQLIDINRLELAKIEEMPDGGLRLGALARNADTADHPLVRERYPLLAQAILAGASPQLRNLATNGGNLLQRTRCYYFYDPAFRQCNKREPGSGCAAIQGYNRIHAILGASPQCIATHPSDMCVALAALGAVVQVRGGRGSRSIAFADFHRLPDEHPEIDTNLRPDELILSIDLPRSPYAEHSTYLKVRDRASYAFALVSAAAALEMDGATIRSARLALGGVAHKPWRSEKAEALLAGKPANEESYRAAANEAVAGAKTYEYNAFKVEMAKETIVRAFTLASRGRGRESEAGA